MRFFSAATLCALFTIAAGCGAPASEPEPVAGPSDEAEARAKAQQELLLSASKKAIAYDYAKRDNMIHGIAGDSSLVFLTEVLAGKIVVLDRFTGRQVAELPAPPGGFLLPFTMRVPAKGKLVVLDAGGFPIPGVPAIPRVYDYSYSYNSWTRTFQANLTRTVNFEGLPVGFSEDVEVNADGSYVVSDSILGSLWLIEPNGTITPGLVPTDPSQGLAKMAPCFGATATVQGIPFDVGGGFAPGVGSIASRNGFVYWGSLCHGGIQRVPLATLRDTSRTPEARAASDIQNVTPKQGDWEVIKGLTFNQYDPDDSRLYALDCFRSRLLRIDVNTGARETLIENPTLLNFPVAAHFISPELGVPTLVVSSDQEHRFDALNFAIDEDLLQPPFIAAKVLIHH